MYNINSSSGICLKPIREIGIDKNNNFENILRVFKIVKNLTPKIKITDMGIEPMTTGLKVLRSTD